MKKRIEGPVSRLICFGSARAQTKAPGGSIVQEFDNGPYYDL